MKTNTTETRIERAPVEAGVTVRLGLDVHAAQITVCRQVDGRLPQPAQQLSWSELITLVKDLVAGGARVFSCYEAGPCGYGLHRQLAALGATNYVVAPQCWDERHRRVKTDKRDARELCNRLERYSRGNTDAFSVVRVPTVEQERQRALTRQRGAVLKERQRCIVRGFGLMLAQGVHAPEGWWQPPLWRVFSPELPDWLRSHVRWWQSQAVSQTAALNLLTEEVEALAVGQLVPKGVGALTSAVLGSEILDWHRFDNRRQVGSYTGLCPSEFTTGKSRKQGSITKCGNRRVRHQLVEAVWRLQQWQPAYPPLAKIRAATNSRARKRAVTAAARRLAVDLWRINTGQCPPEKLGLKMIKH
jgi:transposase